MGQEPHDSGSSDTPDEAGGGAAGHPHRRRPRTLLVLGGLTVLLAGVSLYLNRAAGDDRRRADTDVRGRRRS